MLEFAVAMSIAIACSVAGDFLVKQGATNTRGIDLKEIGGWAGVLQWKRLKHAIEQSGLLKSKRLLAGIGLLSVHFAGFIVAMRLAPVTLVVPLMACTYVATTILGRTLLHEKVTLLRWAGVGVIVVGVVVLGISSLN